MEWIRTPAPEENDPDRVLDHGVLTGKGKLQPTHVTCTGNSSGGLSATQAACTCINDDLDSPHPGTEDSLLAGGVGF
jgi:hypothetical protein